MLSVTLISVVLGLLALVLACGAILEQSRLKQTARRLLEAHERFGDQLGRLEETLAEELGETNYRSVHSVLTESGILRSYSHHPEAIGRVYREHSDWEINEVLRSWLRTPPHFEEQEILAEDGGYAPRKSHSLLTLPH